MSRHHDSHERIVISGVGLLASVGQDRESVWRAVQAGKSGVRSLDGWPLVGEILRVGAPAEVEPELPGRLRVIEMQMRTAAEALADARVDFNRVDRDRFGCAISAHMGDTRLFESFYGHPYDPAPGEVEWWEQWLPNTGCTLVASRFGLHGPRLSHAVACASGLIDILAVVRAIEADQCDIALAGSADAFHPLMAAGFQAMRVLAYHADPTQACRPFDSNRQGFVMGEGSAMFVIERLSHALARGATIYAEVIGGKNLAQAFHVTGLDGESEALAYLIEATLRQAGIGPRDVGYINAHGTGTQQNDLAECRGIRRALGPAADETWVSATKSMLGHLITAAGSVELAITTLALRDGFVPPTKNLTHPDPGCDLDCIPLVGRYRRFEHALKLSVAFGGHLAAIALRRWNDARTGFAYPTLAPAAKAA